MPYREPGRELTDRDLVVPAPGCPCGTSPETRAAYAAVGGWEHTAECLRRRRLRRQLQRQQED